MTPLRDRIRAGERLIGTFVKTPAPHVAELLGLAGVDFIVVDREHAPMDLAALDLLALGARAAGLPMLFRATTAAADAIWPALDLGAAGVMVPHVCTADQAGAVADAVKYARGKRGFSPSARAGGYGTLDPAAYRTSADATSVILAQIEDAMALDHLEAIAAQPDVDVLFIGPADLALSLGCAASAQQMIAATDQVIAAAQKAGKAVGIYVGSEAQIKPLAARGISVFVCGSDQGLLLNAARQMVRVARGNA